jgi:hypothetical protein
MWAYQVCTAPAVGGACAQLHGQFLGAEVLQEPTGRKRGAVERLCHGIVLAYRKRRLPSLPGVMTNAWGNHYAGP